MTAPVPRGLRAGRTATLCSTASDEAATALMPAFLAGTLAASPIALGVIEGLASVADGAARLAGGALAENPRRRGWISAGSYALMALLAGLVAVAASAVQVGVLRGGSAAARGLRSPQRYASVPERVASAGYGRAFGFERGVHHLASVGGPLLAFAVLAVAGVRSALLAAVVPGLVATVIGIVLLRRRGRAVPAPAQAPRLRVRAVYTGPLGRLMTGITLFELANFAAVLLVLRATKLLESRDVPFGPAAMAVLLYLLWRLAAAASSPVCGRWVDRAGPVPVMAAGVASLLASYAGFALATGTVAQLALCFAAAGAAGGAIEAAEHVGVAQVAPAGLRWSAFGSLSAVRSFGRMTATIGATVVWELLGPGYGLMLATPFMVAAVVVMARGYARSPAVGRIVTAVAVTALVVVLPALLVLLLDAGGGLRGY
ncbi:MAG: MFS transporter [Pseudonocardia sp.]